ncbi:DUF2971 domain-containing protein [Sideroxydans sp. CL21]|uniref:DUF2971 domain-containing protein n=1 Tax=Sideroxydans sp. CL21 TaxID=2600596 RepID=UPI0024BD4946|nr:DUF2971 domain-containing protein [Sideroxydans sp. CL21]
MATTKPTSYLRRYTDLPALLYLLHEQKITLLDPKSWDDSNDSHYLSQYKEKKKLKSVLALCFSQTAETYHHWRVFSPGPSGVCIVFNRAPLLASFKLHKVKTQDVEYLTLVNARKRSFRTNELPFIKRAAFKPESEFRAVFESATEELPSINIPIDLSCIRSISLSPWLHKSLAQTTTTAIRAVDGCKKLKVSKSTLIANEEWKSIAAKAT